MTTATLRSNDNRMNGRVIATGTSSEVQSQLDRWLQIRQSISLWTVLQISNTRWILYTADKQRVIVNVDEAFYDEAMEDFIYASKQLAMLHGIAE